MTDRRQGGGLYTGPERRAPKLPCPECGERTLVIRSIGIHRTRRCEQCGAELSTREVVYAVKKTAISSTTGVDKPTP